MEATIYISLKDTLLRFTNKGIYCPLADVYIDPWRPVRKALITHGHSDHARYGSKQYIATHGSLPIIKYRLGGNIKISGVSYGEKILINGVEFCFTPAGHIIGSAQISVTYKGERWVVSGDYKLQNDGISGEYEPIKCHHFITESTFGLPVFKWQPQEEVMHQINAWWQQNKSERKVSIIAAYSLGKAQRIINNVDHTIGKIYTHSAIENTNEILRLQGEKILNTTRLTPEDNQKTLSGHLLIVPPAALDSNFIKRLRSKSDAVASGWMALRGTRRRRSVDRGFILSDHVDWDDLNTAVKESNADHIYVTHGYTDTYARYLKEKGFHASVVKTEYNGDNNEDPTILTS